MRTTYKEVEKRCKAEIEREESQLANLVISHKGEKMSDSLHLEPQDQNSVGELNIRNLNQEKRL